jgi:hypothetical protein
VITDLGIDELSLKKRHKLYVAVLTDLSDPDRRAHTCDDLGFTRIESFTSHPIKT